MGLFHRKSRWERLLDLVGSTVPVRRVAQGALGAVGGLVGATAISAAVSTRRDRDKE
jgi:hypothetical protein